MGLKRRYSRLVNFFVRSKRRKIAKRKLEVIAEKKRQEALKAAAFKPEFEGRLPTFRTCIKALNSMDDFKVFAEFCKSRFDLSPNETVDLLARSLTIFEETTEGKMTPQDITALRSARTRLGVLIHRFPEIRRR